LGKGREAVGLGEVEVLRGRRGEGGGEGRVRKGGRVGIG